MKLAQYRPDGMSDPQAGVLRDGEVVGLEGTDGEVGFGEALRLATTEGLDRLLNLAVEDTSQPREQVDLMAPVGPEGRVFCLGGVYTGHLADAGLSIMVDPNQWVMPENTVIGPDAPIVLPERVAEKVMPAAELCIVVGKAGKYVDPTNAFDYIAGYTISNDVTARTDWPGPMGYKMMDTFSPVGPFVRTADEVPAPSDLEITMRQDGDPICRGSTAGMRFTLSFMLSYISIITELQPGDVISTGDPGGVQEPLAPGKTVEITIEDIGTLRNPVEGEE
jgi:2-keto-4-pentenoate hydratase/2-oxohepta-3-ene-1,7-dioic acid hydratase in catechol pathway